MSARPVTEMTVGQLRSERHQLVACQERGVFSIGQLDRLSRINVELIARAALSRATQSQGEA